MTGLVCWEAEAAQRRAHVLMELPLLCLFAFLAGLVDAIVGGGGLIQLPALLLFLPVGGTHSLASVLGTNKLSSICGTATAVVQYARRVAMPWRIVLPAAGTAFVASMLGARFVASLNPEVLRPLARVSQFGEVFDFFRGRLCWG